MLSMAVALALAAGTGQDPPAAREGFAVMDDGVRIHYRVVGESGEAVVVPVAVLTSPHFDALAGEHRVVYYDPRGRGRSEVGNIASVSRSRNLRDLEALREHLRLDRMALVGFSGYGLEFAMYALDHPGRVSHLVQLAPVPPRLTPWMDARGGGIEQRADKAAAAEYERLVKSNAATGEGGCVVYQRSLAPAFTVHPERIDVAAICAHPNEWPENQSRLWAAFMPSMQGVDLRSRVVELRMPRLVIWPERDLIPLEGVREWLVDGAPVRLLVVAEADHSVFVDRPDAVIPAIKDFLRSESRKH